MMYAAIVWARFLRVFMNRQVEREKDENRERTPHVFAIPSGSFLLAAEVPAVAAGVFVFLERMEDPRLE